MNKIENTSKNKVILEVKNLKKYFYNPSGIIKAIDDVNFNLHQGEIMGLIGESGSGKTTIGRTLIRLYSEYNGFVSFKNEIISGLKLPKEKRKFLHRNMQMIFQNPHASLNLQQNVYTILKEPLLVNGILKDMYKDLFNDLSQVQKYFKYTFLQYFSDITLANYDLEIQTFSNILIKWEPFLKKITFSEDETDENNFAKLFSYLDEKQIQDTELISTFYASIKKLSDFYFDKQKDYREGNLLNDEKNLKIAEENYLKAKSLSKKSLRHHFRIKHLSKQESELKKAKKDFANQRKSTKLFLLSYVKEFKSDYLLYKFEYEKQKDIFSYNHFYQLYTIYKKVYSYLKFSYLTMLNISLDQARVLITQLKLYKDDLIKKLWKPSLEILESKKIRKFVEANFVFDNLEFTTISKNNQLKTQKLLSKIKNNISLLTRVLKVKEKPAYSNKQLNKFKEDFIKAQDIYKNELRIYIEQNQKQYDEIQTKITIRLVEHKKLLTQLNNLKTLFDQIKNKFYTFLQSKSKVSKKDLKIQIDVFETNVAAKYESLKSFKIEFKQLQLAMNRIKHLYGIKKKTPFSRKLIKKLILDDKIFNILDDVGLLRQFAWRYPHEFSGGQRQRIVIARALISNPKIIIADEPIASLDVSIQAQIVNLLKDLCKNKNVALIFIAHDLSMVEYIADYIHIIHLGKIVESGITEKIYKNPRHPYTINLFSSITKISNANESFKSSNFELDYLKEQTKLNKPKFFKIEKDHFIYATNSQYENWVNSTRIIKSS